MKDVLKRWVDRRIDTRARCWSCGSYDGVLRHRHCRDELELYCDHCETWRGIVVTREEAHEWSQPAAPVCLEARR